MSAPDPPTADFDAALDAVLARVRGGGRADLTKVAEDRPDLAAKLRDLLPLLLALEAAPTKTPEATRLGEYAVGKEVGRGAMGVVYEATHATLGKRVALKVLTPTAAGKEDRFLREARLAAGLHHSNIVPVFDVGTANGTAYYAMQFIDGTTLAAALPTLSKLLSADGAATAALAGPAAAETGFTLAPPAKKRPGLPPRIAAAYLAQAAEALGYAHARGIVHRDVKPGNLLLDAAGTVWVADFGLAFHRDDATITAAGAILGTPRYMAPEQAGGGSKDVDARADVYALGVTLYELLTGADPFPGRRVADVLRMAADHVPPPPRTLDRKIPRDLDTVVQKAMAKRPADRYADGAALAADLRRFLNGEPVTARRISPVGRAWRWARRNRAVAALLAAVAGLLVILAAGSAAAAVRLDGLLGRAVAAETAAEAREADARLEAARGHRLSRRPGQRFAALDDLRAALTLGRRTNKPAAWFDGARSEAFNILALPDLYPDRPLPGLDPGDAYGDTDEAFTRAAVVRKSGRLEIVTLPTGTAAPINLPGANKRGAVFGPKSWLAVTADPPHAFQIVDAAAPAAGAVLTLAAPPRRFAFAPDGTKVLVADGRTVRVYGLPGGTALAAYPYPAGATEEDFFAFDPAGTTVAAASYSGRSLILFDVAAGAVLQNLPSPFASASTLSNPVFTAAGRHLVVAEGDGPHLAVFRYDAAARRAAFDRTVAVNGSGGKHLFAGADGRTLMACGWAPGTVVVDVDAGREIAFDRAAGNVFGALRTAAAGDRAAAVAANGAGAAHWRLDRGFDCRLIPVPEILPGNPIALTPDGRIAWVATATGPVAVDLVHGRAVGRFTAPPPTVPAFAADAAGNLVTQGDMGMWRWPLRRAGLQYDYGPPEQVEGIPPGSLGPAVSADGAVVATAVHNSHGMNPVLGGWYARRGRPGAVRTPPPHARTITANVTPNGQYAVFTDAAGVAVFRTDTGAAVTRLPGTAHPGAVAPNGAALAVEHDGRTHLYDTGTWKRGRDLGPGTLRGYSPDSQYALVHYRIGAYRLIRTADGVPVLAWEDPDLEIVAAAFTPDGSRLVSPAKEGLRVWDLAALRAGLTALDLDYAGPPSPPAPAFDPVPAAVTVRGDVTRP